VLCTATQPAIKRYLRERISPAEIVGQGVFDADVFKRVQFENKGKISKEVLEECLSECRQALCVVNNKKLAKALFASLPEDGRYHLSGYMCPAHRSAVLAVIKARLATDIPVRVISTQLIEAGVDIDFPVVYRELSGIDSIIQAAGRCNREGKREYGRVVIFQVEGEKRQGFLERTAARADETLRYFERVSPESMLDSPEVVERYFDLLYALENNGMALDAKNILGRIDENKAPQVMFPFKDIGQDFKLIQNDTAPIIVPYNEEAKLLIAQLEYGGVSTIRKLQKYTVNVYGGPDESSLQSNSEFQRLLNNGGLRVVNGIYYVLNKMSAEDDRFYTEGTGIKFEGEELIW
jgi:CRISPR-associated endonuclease/helicase Cas3